MSNPVRLGSRGASLILNLLLMSVFSLLAAVVYATAKSQVTIVTYNMRQAQAQAIAEAGIEDALHSLYQSRSWRTGFANKTFASGYYTVTLSSGTPPYIQSTGYSKSLLLPGRAVRTVSLYALFHSSTTNANNSVTTNSLDARGTIDAYDPSMGLMPSTFMYGGTIWSNGNFDTSGASCPPANVKGNAVYHQGSTAPDGPCVGGTITSTTTVVGLASFPCGTCDTINDNATGITDPGGAYQDPPGNLVINGTTVTLKATATGIFYFKQIQILGGGVLNIDTSAGTVYIYYSNKFTANDPCQINNIFKDPSKLIISDVATGSHNDTFACFTPMHAHVYGGTNHLVYQNYAGGGQELYGYTSGADVTIESNAKIHFDLGAGVSYDHLEWTVGTTGSWSESFKRQ